MLNEALQYLKLGWSVVPTCWPVLDGVGLWVCGCGRGHSGNDIGKAALVSWKHYQELAPAVEEAIAWWTQWPDANIALITGSISRLVVVDLEHDGLAEAERLAIWSPVKVFTGKGYHLYFAHPGDRVCNGVAIRKIKGLDLRGDGGYVLLPPSRHATGKRYMWASAAPACGTRLPDFPRSLFAENVKGTVIEAPKAKPAGWIAESLESLSNGNRNSTFASIVGRLHGQRWGASDIRSLLLPHALRVEFPEAELDTVIRSVTRYPVTIRAASSVAVADEAPKLAVYTLEGSWNEYERSRAGFQCREYATGYARLDHLLGGGLQREELLTLAAWTGVGKTNWLLGMVRRLCVGGKRVLFLSTEMSRRKIWDRYIALVGTADEARLHALSVADEFIPNPVAIRAAVADYKPDVLVFDHIHNVSEENVEVGTYFKSLKECVKDAGICGVVAAQFNKNADFTDDKGKRVPPRMSMIKGTSTIIQVSAQILLLDERDDTPEQKDILGVLDKNRDGEKGLISFVLKKRPYRMEEA